MYRMYRSYYRAHSRSSARPVLAMVAMLRLRGEFSWLWPVRQLATPVSPLTDFYLRRIENNAEGGWTLDWIMTEWMCMYGSEMLWLISKNSELISATTVNEN